MNDDEHLAVEVAQMSEAEVIAAAGAACGAPQAKYAAFVRAHK